MLVTLLRSSPLLMLLPTTLLPGAPQCSDLFSSQTISLPQHRFTLMPWSTTSGLVALQTTSSPGFATKPGSQEIQLLSASLHLGGLPDPAPPPRLPTPVNIATIYLVTQPYTLEPSSSSFSSSLPITNLQNWLLL